MKQFDDREAIILLAEDDLGHQELTRRALEKTKKNHELYIVNDGVEAMDYLLQKGKYQDPKSSPKPDIILLDLNMPKMDGWQVLEQIKNNPTLRHLTVTVLSSSQHNEDVQRCYENGANSFIMKPVGMCQLFQIFEVLENYWFHIVTLPTNHETVNTI